MNRNGRLVGGVLVGIALLWLLRILGALPFSDRTTNQIGNQANAQIPPDRPLITNFDETRTSIANFNPQNPNPQDPNFQDPNFQNPQNPNSQSPNSQNPQEVAQRPGGGTSTRPAAPVVPGAW